MTCQDEVQFIAVAGHLVTFPFTSLKHRQRSHRILVMKPVGTFLQKLLKRFPKLVVQLVYLLIHLFFSTCTMSMAVLMWHSQIAHFLFLGSIGLSTVKNAASFYFDVFESQYAQVIGGEDSKKRLHEKLLVSASPGLAELQDPLKKKSS